MALPCPPIELASVEELRRLLQQVHRVPVLIPVNDSFVAALTAAEQPLAGAAMLKALTELLSSQRVAPAWKIIDAVADVVVGSRKGEFMGPMCCPLTRAELTVVADPRNEYLVTEKSDGIRAIVVSKAVHRYPRWYVLDPNGSRSMNMFFTFFDQVTLESALTELINDGAEFKAGIGLSCGTCKLMMRDDADMSRFTLRRLVGDDMRVEDIAIERVKSTRHFTFMFDRSMAATYLINEEYPFPAHVTDIVLDGELLLSYQPRQPAGRPNPPPRCLYAVFDMFSYSTFERPMQEASGAAAVQQGGFTGPAEREYLADATMAERYAAIVKHIFEPMNQRAMAELIPLGRAIEPRVKKMVPIDRVLELVQNMMVVPQERDSAAAALPTTTNFDASYFFLEMSSYNDGLIFTPNKFDVVAGSCPRQFKWKWPGKLTIDFMARAAPASDNPTDEPTPMQRVALDLNFKQRGSHGQSDRSGHVTVATEHIFCPATLKFAEPTVVECSICRSPATGRVAWRVDKVRSDKAEANSMIAAFSVLESIAENLTLRVVCEALGHRAQSHSALYRRFEMTSAAETQAVQPAPDDVFEDERTGEHGRPVIPVPRMLIRARNVEGRAYPSVQWQVRLRDMKSGSLLCNHRPVEQCLGFGELCPADERRMGRLEDALSSPLIGRVLIELANNGGCVGWSDTSCDAAYDPESGRWVLSNISGAPDRKNVTWASHVFAHLDALAKFVVAHRRSPRLRAVETYKATAGDASVCRGGDDEGQGAATTGGHPPLAPSDAHYAERTRALAAGSARSALRRHNNWVKAVVLARGVRLAQQSNARADKRIACLDLCCGRGGDLHKIAHMPLTRALLLDSCFEAVVEAAGRYSTGKHLSTCSVKDKGVPMTFAVADCFDDTTTWSIVSRFIAANPTDVAAQHGFDLVSCQFSMHYAFGCEKTVRGFLSLVAKSLRPGGVFVATTVDDRTLTRMRAEHGDSFGNEDFHVQFLAPDEAETTYGAAYRITVQQSVRNEKEYVVDWQRFLTLAATYGLELVETSNLTEVQPGDLAADLVEQLTGAEPNDEIGETGAGKRDRAAVDIRAEMTNDELQTASLFRALIMRKTAP